MTVAISAFSAAVAFGNIVSSDVVGYSQSDLRSGFAPAGAQFVSVSGTGINIQDITVVGYDGETAGDVDIQILDNLGRMTTQYFWVDLPDDDIYGWLDGDDEPADVTFQPGEGLWVNAPNSDFKLQTAGKVPTSGVAVTLREGFKMVANPTPVNVDIQDISISGYVGETAGDVDIQILDTLGRMVNQYFWVDLPDDGIYGWLDGDDEPVEALIAPGAGLWVNAPSAEYSIVLPGVTL